MCLYLQFKYQNTFNSMLCLSGLELYSQWVPLWDVLQCSIFCSNNMQHSCSIFSCWHVFISHGIVCIKFIFVFILSSVSSQAQRLSNRICVASEVQKRCLKRKSEGKCNNVMSNNQYRKCLLKSHNLNHPGFSSTFFS